MSVLVVPIIVIVIVGISTTVIIGTLSLAGSLPMGPLGLGTRALIGPLCMTRSLGLIRALSLAGPSSMTRLVPLIGALGSVKLMRPRQRSARSGLRQAAS